MMWQFTQVDYFLLIAGVWALIATGTVIALKWVKR